MKIIYKYKRVILFLSFLVVGCSANTNQEVPTLTTEDQNISSEVVNPDELTIERVSNSISGKWEVYYELDNTQNIYFKNTINNETQEYEIPNASNYRWNEVENKVAVSYYEKEALEEYVIVDLQNMTKIKYSIFDDSSFLKQINLSSTEKGYLESPGKWSKEGLKVEIAYKDSENVSWVGKYQYNETTNSFENLTFWEADDTGFSIEKARYDLENINLEELNQDQPLGQYAWSKFGTNFGLIAQQNEDIQIYGYIEPTSSRSNDTQVVIVKIGESVQYFEVKADMNDSSHSIIYEDLDGGAKEVGYSIFKSGGTGVGIQELHILDIDPNGKMQEVAKLDADQCMEILNERIRFQYEPEDKTAKIQIDDHLIEYTDETCPDSAVKETHLGGVWLFSFIDNKIQLTLGNPRIVLEDGTKIMPGQFVAEVIYENETLSIGNIQFNEEWYIN